MLKASLHRRLLSARATWVQWKDHESTYLCFMAKGLKNRDKRNDVMAITEDTCDQVMDYGMLLV